MGGLKWWAGTPRATTCNTYRNAAQAFRYLLLPVEGPLRPAALIRRGVQLPFRAMGAPRLFQLLLLILLPATFAGTPGLSASAHPLPLPSAAESPAAISAPTQSIPAPVHDESICAFCQAAAFAPYAAVPACGLPEALASEEQELITPDERLPHVGSSRPPSSRAPPTLRDS